jgi:hypothetical protein
MEALHGEQKCSDMFVAYLLARNIRYEEELVEQLVNSSEKRLAHVLLLLAHFGKESCRKAWFVRSVRKPGRDDRHQPIASQLLHEPVQEAGFHPLQRAVCRSTVRCSTWFSATSPHILPLRRTICLSSRGSAWCCQCRTGGRLST